MALLQSYNQFLPPNIMPQCACTIEAGCMLANPHLSTVKYLHVYLIVTIVDGY